MLELLLGLSAKIKCRKDVRSAAEKDTALRTHSWGKLQMRTSEFISFMCCLRIVETWVQILSSAFPSYYSSEQCFICLGFLVWKMGLMHPYIKAAVSSEVCPQYPLQMAI